jgi:CRISPR-associated protein Csd2
LRNGPRPKTPNINRIRKYSMSSKYTDSTKRHDFVWLFDVTDGNPNGDPDNDNLPRTDPETGQGLVTDVCLKRKVRDYVSMSKNGDEGYRIYVQKNDTALNSKHEEAYAASGKKSTGTKQKRDDVLDVQKWMCEKFYDIRTFGAVMTTGVNCGQVRGPVQMTFSRSIDRVFAYDLSITRVAVTKPEDALVAVGEDEKGKGKQTEMGLKALLPYGLYLGHGFFNPLLAKGSGFNDADLTLFWEAMQGMFDLDRSASRGWMELRGLYIFSHDKPTGNAPAHVLFDRIRAVKKESVESPRKFADYDVSVAEGALSEGITLEKLVR